MATYAQSCDGTSLLGALEAQRRYADGVKSSLSRFMSGCPIEAEFLIVDNGKVVSPSYSYAFKT